MVQFRDYQKDIIKQGTEMLERNRFLYLAMEVRTGKTLTAFGICQEFELYNVLFVTKKKAISSIQKDYNLLKPRFKITIINYESLHLVKDIEKWDVVILDEAHCLGAFAKPSARAKLVKEVITKYKPLVVLMSGTPTPEGYSQMYHQVYGIPNNPFNDCSNFYKFAAKYVDVKERMIGAMRIKDYSAGRETIIDAMRPFTINYTQKEAGFASTINENFLTVKMKDSTYAMIKRLTKDLVLEGKEETILADTAVKLMSKVHQMYSGTVKFESGNSMVIDDSKAQFIRDYFCQKKIGIFYKFKEELKALEAAFGQTITESIEEFNNTDKNIALQIVSGREGISLKAADCLVYYNIDFSATSYWQSRDRMTTKDRPENTVYWIFAEGGIEQKIYKMVSKKKNFTVSHFKKLLL
jgi:SNF2-related domain